MKFKGKPGKKFYRYVLAHQYARIPKKIELFQFDEKGEAEVKEGVLYPFEFKRLERKSESRKAREKEAGKITVKTEPVKEEPKEPVKKKSPSKEAAKDK